MESMQSCNKPSKCPTFLSRLQKWTLQKGVLNGIHQLYYDKNEIICEFEFPFFVIQFSTYKTEPVKYM